jgi:hypothetical protein
MNKKQRDVFANGLIQIATAAVATLTFGGLITNEYTPASVIFLGIITAVAAYVVAYLLLGKENE